jgi:hypothetical protein
MSERRYAIIIDELSDERREVIQEVVKEKTDTWWHDFPNVWIVSGQDAAIWRDLVRPIIKGTNASVLVLLIPEDEVHSRWASFGPGNDQKMKWFKENI